MSSVFINVVFITFSPRVVDCVTCLWSNFLFIYDTLILSILHYITLQQANSQFLARMRVVVNA